MRKVPVAFCRMAIYMRRPPTQIDTFKISVLQTFEMLLIRGCIQRFPDWVDNEISNNNNTRWEATRRLWRQNLLYWLTK